MTVGDFILLLAVILLIVGFAGLLLAIVRVNDSLGLLKEELGRWRQEVGPLVDSLRESTQEARSAMDEARHDLGRFDRVLGSAEAISGAVEGSAKVTRAALSTPVIKIAALVSGTSRTARQLRRPEAAESNRRRR